MTILRAFGTLMRETLKEWMEDGGASIAAALAYYAIFSLSPLLILLALVIGLVMDQQTVEDNIIGGVEQTVGEDAAITFRQILSVDTDSTQSTVVGSIVWLSVMVWGASGLFAQLQNALNKIWEVKPMPGRSPLVFFKNRAFSFFIVIVGSLLFLTSLVINTGLSVLIQNQETAASFALIIRPLQIGLSIGIITLMFAVIFKVLPDVIISWRDVMVGALFTAGLFYLGQFLVGLYLANSNIGSVFGAAGSLTVILVWIYYSAQILLFGAEFTEVWARHHGASIRPDADAVWINEEQARREAEAAGVDFVTREPLSTTKDPAQ